MTTETPDGDLSDELRELGRNLKAAAKTAWESEESRRLQQELKSGLAALEVAELGAEFLRHAFREGLAPRFRGLDPVDILRQHGVEAVVEARVALEP